VILQTPLTILLVDDSTADRVLYRSFLSSTGTYSFLEAAIGEEGLRLCQTTKPDCLILDFYLPDMDGFEFLDALQGDTASLPYPVVRPCTEGYKTM
jgi:CheY-like chemotaxis protein